jgi:hypothetical protein
MKKYIFLILILFCSCLSTTKNTKSTEGYEASIANDNPEEYIQDSTQVMTGSAMVTEDSYYVSEEIELRNERVMSSAPQQLRTQPINSGTLSFSVDSIFTIDVLSRVEARIINSVNKDDVNTMVQLLHKSKNGTIQTRNIKVGNIMDMKLVSFDKEAFEIEALSSDNQVIENNTSALWIWAVKPKKLGEQQLIIKAIIKENGNNIERVVYDEIIPVVNKPKKLYNIKISISDKLIQNKVNTITLDIEECNDCNGILLDNSGIIKLVLYDTENYNVVTSENIFSAKKYQSYKWELTPKKTKKMAYSIIMKTDDQKILLHDGTIDVKFNLKVFIKNVFINALDVWEFLLTFLLIPIGIWIKKKYFSKKEKVD